MRSQPATIKKSIIPLRQLRYAALLLALLLAACDTVQLEQPIGQPVDLSEGPGWAGTWLNSAGEASMLRITDAGQGQAELYWIEIDEQQPVLKQARLLVHRVDSVLVLQLQVPGDPHWYFAAGHRDGTDLSLWPPRTAGFAEWVEAGRLPGSVNEDQVRLAPLNAAQAQSLFKPMQPALFDWAQPISTRRVSDD